MTDTAAQETQIAPQAPSRTGQTTFAVLFAISFCHMLNDVLQSLLAAIYPMLKEDYGLAFWQIGLLTLSYQLTASLLQPAVGLVMDRRPMRRALPFGMASSLVGLVLLAFGTTYPGLLLGAMLIGLGSAVFHPEASRVARMASGGRFGLAQSLFQVGGNFGTAIGPLLAAFIIVPRGQSSVAWFALVAFIGILVLRRVALWHGRWQLANARAGAPSRSLPFDRKTVKRALVVLMLLTFSKNIYTASIMSYYTFFTIDKFGVPVQVSQFMLFLFLGAVALGTLLGGPIGDRIGSKAVIWVSILGVLPFTLALPYADLFWTGVLSVAIGFILASAFPAIVVFAQELVPGRVGMIAGAFFGLAFGMGGIAAAGLGVLADAHGIDFVFRLCSFLPLIGLLTVFLPDMRAARKPA